MHKHYNDRMYDLLTRKFRAEIHNERSVEYATPSSYYEYDYSDRHSYSTNHMSYQTYTVPVYSITMREPEMNAFFEYIDHLYEECNRYGSASDPRYFVDNVRRQYEDELHEEKLRKENPALQDAWEQYQALKALLS